MRYLLTLILAVVMQIAFAQTETTVSAPAAPKTEAAPSSDAPDNKPAAKKKKSTNGSNYTVSKVYKGKRDRSLARGYRIQVYSGAGGTKSKEAAQAMAAKVRAKFPGISVYCRFKSPRWVCRIGDFPTKAVAEHFLHKVQLAKISNEASVVIDDVFLAK